MCADVDTLPPGERSAYSNGFADGKASAAQPVPQAGEVAEIVSRLRALDLPWRHEAADIITGQAARIEYLEGTLLHIEMMDVYTREGEESAHELMRRIAREARTGKKTA
jgi:hypothetical protein